jgi:hypothetical protein
LENNNPHKMAGAKKQNGLQYSGQAIPQNDFQQKKQQPIQQQ